MTYFTKAAECWRASGATNDETDYFFIFVAHKKMIGKESVMVYIDFEQDC